MGWITNKKWPHEGGGGEKAPPNSGFGEAPHNWKRMPGRILNLLREVLKEEEMQKSVRTSSYIQAERKNAGDWY